MSHPNVSTALARVIVDELLENDVDLFVIAPGSRSGALAIAAAESSSANSVVVIDERSAAFQALGYVKAGGRAAVISTSGSATANFYPAVVEADMSCASLVVITADRPAELRGVGANQTIAQSGLYGSRVRAAVDIEAPERVADLNRVWREQLQDLIERGSSSRPGPVHLNVAFREPTVPVENDGRTAGESYPYETPRLDRSAPTIAKSDSVLPHVDGRRGLIVAGDGVYDREALLRRSKELNWPVLATAMSGMRGMGVVTTYHHLLATDLERELRPEVVVVVGTVGPSPRLESMISGVATQIRVDRWGRTIDPSRTSTAITDRDVIDVLEAASSADLSWVESWLETDMALRALIEAEVVSGPISGALVAHELNEVDMGVLVAASSLPVREIDAHFTRGVPVVANRGASGIDGFVSTAIGVATRLPRTIAVAGDLSFLHDSNGFLTEQAPDIVFVLLDNNGGGLFDSLPQATHAPQFERLFVTPHNRDLETLVRFHGHSFRDVSDLSDLARLVDEGFERGGVSVLRVGIDRDADLSVRQRLDQIAARQT